MPSRRPRSGNTTGIQFFDQNGNVLGTFFAPAAARNDIPSFLGVTKGAGVDLVVMDDFAYVEAAVPEPTTLLLTGAGLLALIALR
jgi:hypothetical protein